MALDFEKFKKDPSLYVFFLSLVALTSLFFKLDSARNVRDIEKNTEIQYWKQKDSKNDSIIHKLYFLNGMKTIIDSIQINSHGK